MLLRGAKMCRDTSIEYGDGFNGDRVELAVVYLYGRSGKKREIRKYEGERRRGQAILHW